jgi:hypothetical protein
LTLTADETTKAASGAVDQPSRDGADGSTSKEQQPRTYTEAELESIATKRVSDALADQGRKNKSALSAAERRAETKVNDSLAELRTENEKLQAALDDMAADDEDKNRLKTLLRENKKEQEGLKKLKQDWEPRIAKAEEWELTNLCAEIAGDYEGGDPVRLARVASRIKVLDGEDRADAIRDIADDFWTKKSAKPPAAEKPVEQPRKVDNGVTTGKTSRKPTLEELRAASPEEVVAKFTSGEWTRNG